MEQAATLLGERLEVLTSPGPAEWIDFQVQVAEALEHTHQRLGEGSPDLPRAGLTATLLAVTPEGFRLAHLGAGRPMLFSRRFLHPLTREHSVAFAAYERGELRAGELRGHPEARRLTRGLGVPDLDPMEATAAEYRRGGLQDGDQLMVAAGDLLTFVDEDTLLERLEDDQGAQDTARALVELSLEQGGQSSGCLLIRLREGEIEHGWAQAAAADQALAAPEAEGEAAAADRPPPEDEELPPIGELPEWVDGAVAEESSDQLLREQPLMPVKMPPEVLAILSGKSVEEALATRQPGAAGEPATASPRPSAPPPPRTPPPARKVPPAAPPRQGPRIMAPAEQPPPARRRTAPTPARESGRIRVPSALDQRGERWVEIGQEGTLDSPIWVGLVLVGALVAMAGLFWMSLVRA